MKLGLLSLVSTDVPTEESEATVAGSRERLVAALEAAGHHVVPAEKPAAHGVAASDEAARFARADCDGMVLCFFSGDGAAVALEIVPGMVVQAALHAACPLLLASDDLPVLLAASGALQEIGVSAGRTFGAPDEPGTVARVQAWAALHDSAERRRGQDAAGKLFGSRYAVLGDPPPGGGDVFAVDAARWLTQFGVHVQHAGASALAGRSISDFCAGERITFCSLGLAADGTVLALPEAGVLVLPAACGANGALTSQLLAFTTGDAAAVFTIALTGRDAASPDRLRVRAVSGETALTVPLTFARITRRLGRFTCLIGTGSVGEDGTALLRPDCGGEALLLVADSPFLHAAPGDLRAALKAACESLDVEPVLLA